MTVRDTKRTGNRVSREPVTNAYGLIPVSLITGIMEHIADRHSSLTEDERLIIAVWIIHTYLYDCLPFTTYLHIASHEPNAGKTTVGEILRDLCYGAQLDSPTVAALSTFKGPDKHTLILDEIQDLLSDKRGGGLIADLYRLINLGNRPGNVWSVSGAKPGDRDERDPYFCKAFIGIGLDILREPLAQRSIRIIVRPGNDAQQTERERRQGIRPVNASALELRSQLVKIADTQRIRSAVIDGISSSASRQLNGNAPSLINRDADIWRPMIAIADLSKAEYGKRMRDIASRYVTAEPESLPNPAERVDLAFKHLFRSRRLLAFNWYHGPTNKPLPSNAEYPMSNDDFGWPKPRNPQSNKLPECSLVFNAREMKAELRFKANEFPAICEALNIKMSAKDVRDAYADAGRLHAQTGRASIPLAFIAGHKETSVVGIDISCWLWSAEKD